MDDGQNYPSLPAFFHRIEITNSRGDAYRFVLEDDQTVIISVDGRDMVGVSMPYDGEPGVAVVTWDQTGEATTTYPAGYPAPEAELLYRKCAQCHLFIEEQGPDEVVKGYAKYIHSHRGDEPDTELDESHMAYPEPGPGAPLTWWKQFGPPAMRARFIDDDDHGGPEVSGDRGHCDTCGTTCDAVTGKCMGDPSHVVAIP